ncbi:MAG TPA: hypothetical protein VGB24_17690 [Longimicrobium sp.]|jgi:hypothetical protein|uniref:hypothetical protein n=1 Tax=Longimicrobium sp. TaxID=2029185 RepID=UPI002ED9CD02
MPVNAIRDAVRRAAAATSVRSVARGSGLSDQGLKYFLEGGEPRAGTLRKLTEWYVRDAAKLGELDAETVQAALSVLLADMTEPQLSATRRAVLDAIREGYKAMGRDVPGWLG